jgi:hypothetical protein
MASNTINRKTVREAFATLVDAKFSSDWDVFSYKTPKFGGKARNIVVSSAGSRRTIMGARSEEADSGFRFRVFIFVLYQSADDGWTAQNSEDALDTAEKDLTNLCNDNQSNANWNHLSIEGESDPDNVVDEGGQVFRREIITVRMEKYT